MSPNGDFGLERLLRRADELVASAATMSFALQDVGAIDLPSPALAADQAQLRALATIYLAAELEGAGAVPAAEALVRLARSGSLQRDFRAATPLMQTFWQSRNERVSSEERLAIFGRLFGTGGGLEDAQAPRNTTFEERMIDLCEALYRIDESGAATGGVTPQSRVRSAARRVLGELVRSGTGFSVLVAQEMLSTLKQSLSILGHQDVKASFGARTLWDVVAAVDHLRRQPPRPHALHVRRGQAGMTLLSWVADNAPHLDATGGAPVEIGESVIEAAIDWLEASLALSESTPPPESASTAAPGSDWAALAE